MSAFEKAEQGEIDEALKRQAEPMHAPGHPDLVLRDPPELGWERLPQSEVAPSVRHINRIKYHQWLGPGIAIPEYLR